MIIDAHQHFWTLARGDYPWMAGDAMRPLRSDFGPGQLKPLMDETSVDKTIIVQCRHDVNETADMLAIADAHDFVAGVVGWVDLLAEDVAGQIERLRPLPGGRRLVGIRHIAHDEADAGWLRDAAVQRGVGEVIRAGLTYDLLSRTRELPAAIDLAKAHPGGRFVLDHLAKPPIASGSTLAWERHFSEIAALPNVWCKISGMVTEADWLAWRPQDFDRYLDLALDLFGADRLIFGSDWPVCTLAGSYRDVKAIAARLTDRHPDIADRFYHRNAVAAYQLDL